MLFLSYNLCFSLPQNVKLFRQFENVVAPLKTYFKVFFQLEHVFSVLEGLNYCPTPVFVNTRIKHVRHDKIALLFFDITELKNTKQI